MQKYIMAGIFGALAFVVSLALYPEMVEGTDVLYREFVDSCTLADGTTTLILHTKDKSEKATLFKTSTSGKEYCALAAAAFAGSTALTAYTENGTAVSLTDPSSAQDITTSTWETVPTSISDFNTINKLLLGLLPLLITVGFLGSVFASLWTYTQGSGALHSAITADVIMLVASLVVIYISPTVIEFIVDAADVSENNYLSVTSDFGTITELLYSIMPVGLVLSIMGLISMRGISQYKSFKKGDMQMGGGVG